MWFVEVEKVMKLGSFGSREHISMVQYVFV